METLLGFIKESKKLRKQYLDELDCMLKQKMDEQDEIPITVHSKPMTHKDLSDIANRLSLECKNNINNHRHHHSSSYDTFEKIAPEFHYLKFKPNHQAIKEEQIEEIDLKSKYNKEIHENISNVFLECVHKIKQLGADIYGVYTNPNKYFNRSISSLSGECDCFKFFCRIKHYEFEAIFSDDCESIPGVLSVNKVKNKNTHEIYEMNVDLFCQNSSEMKYKNLNTLLHSKDYHEFYNKTYKMLDHIDQLLLDVIPRKQIEIYKKPNIREDVIVNINEFDFDFYYDIEIFGKRLLLILHENKTNYDIHICPSLEEINEKIKSPRRSYSEIKKIDINSFHFNFRKYGYHFTEWNGKNIQDLIQCIKDYIRFKNDEYGFKTQDGFIHDKTIIPLFHPLENHNDWKFSYEVLNDVYHGTEFKIQIEIKDNQVSNSLSNLSNRIDKPYPFDFYHIEFAYYNKKKKTENQAEFRIEGNYRNTGNKMMNTFIQPILYYERHGEFLNIFDEFKKCLKYFEHESN